MHEYHKKEKKMPDCIWKVNMFSGIKELSVGRREIDGRKIDRQITGKSMDDR